MTGARGRRQDQTTHKQTLYHTPASTAPSLLPRIPDRRLSASVQSAEISVGTRLARSISDDAIQARCWLQKSPVRKLDSARISIVSFPSRSTAEPQNRSNTYRLDAHDRTLPAEANLALIPVYCPPWEPPDRYPSTCSSAHTPLYSRMASTSLHRISL